jgi:hypothetical protein
VQWRERKDPPISRTMIKLDLGVGLNVPIQLML